MRAVWYERFGLADEVLQSGELPMPEPAAGEVRVKLAYSGVNPVDVKRRLGGRGEMTAQRVVPHFDGVGVIDGVGAGVDSVRIGQQVWVYGAQWQRDFGTAAEWVALPERQAVKLPDRAEGRVGACLGIPALTAYPAVFADGELHGQTVLVTGGAGCVGNYAIQFARLAGALTITTVSSDAKAAVAQRAGPQHIINYKEEDVAAKIADLTGGQGVDRIVEVEFGGNLETSLQILKVGGTIATYASQTVPTPAVPFYELMYKSLVVRHVLTFQVASDLLERACSDIGRWLEADQLYHHIGETYPLSETVAAHQAVESGALGKVLIQL